MKSQFVFTPASILDMLLQIDELSDKDIGVSETLDGGIQLQIGESTYIVEPKQETEVEVTEDVSEEIDSANTEAYQEIADDSSSAYTAIEEEPIESGLLKELAKTLLVGGMVRLTNKWLRKDVESK